MLPSGSHASPIIKISHKSRDCLVRVGKGFHVHLHALDPYRLYNPLPESCLADVCTLEDGKGALTFFTGGGGYHERIG